MITTDSKRQAGFGLALIGVISSLAASCRPHPESGDSATVSLPSIAVETAVLKSQEVPVFDEVVGTVRPHLEAQVSAKVTGRILNMHAVPGIKVKKGGILAEIEVEELKAALERAQASQDNAVRDLERYRNLLSTGAATRSEFDVIQMKERIAAATMKETEVMIANATVRAPFDGTVTRKFLDIGDLASPGRPLFSIEDSALLRLEIHVAESLANKVELKAKFRVRVDGAAANMDGAVAEISPSADPASRTFMVKLDLEENKALRAGQFGRAYIPRANRKALKVSNKAIIQRGQMDYVFVVAGGIARLRIIRSDGNSAALATGSTKSRNNDMQREILAGVEDGEIVVISPPPELQDGQKVSVKNDQPASEGSAQKIK